jgi:hypothetical protein
MSCKRYGKTRDHLLYEEATAMTKNHGRLQESIKIEPARLLGVI